MAARDYAKQNISLIMSLRKKGIRDVNVLRAMELVPRDQFVLPAFALQAWLDMALPIDCGQTISQPFVVAYMTEALQLSKDDRVLEIGTGSGYQAAILAELAGKVYSVEHHRELHAETKLRLMELGYTNIETRVGDGTAGWPEHAPFNKIIVTAAAEEPPAALIEQLAEEAILVMPLGHPQGDQFLYKIENKPEGVTRKRLLPVRFVPLTEDGAEEPSDN